MFRQYYLFCSKIAKPIAALLFFAAAFPVQAQSLPVPSQPTVKNTPLEKRLIKVFNFNERPLGNLEDKPMYWEKVTLSGFPHFVNGHLDEKVGLPPPSFRLELNGGNLGYLYTVRQIPAFPGSDHKIFITYKQENLCYARGYIQAFYMDRYGNLLKDTITYSPLIQPSGPDDPEWQTISMELPFTNPKGRFIGIGVFLVQQDHLPEYYSNAAKSLRKDIHAKIWLEDISVLRLPKSRLKLEKDIPVYTDIEDVIVSATVADSIPNDLTAELILTDLSHNKTRSIPHNVADLPPLEAILHGTASPPQLFRHELGKLQPGFYRLVLMVRSDSKPIIERSVNLAVLNHKRSGDQNEDFGVDLTRKPLADPKAIAGFLNALQPGWISLPLWRNDFVLSHSSKELTPADSLIMELNTRNIRIIGAYPQVPANLAGKTDILNPSIWDFLSGDSSWWESEFALILSRHADRIDQWIFGELSDRWINADPRMMQVLKNIRTEFSQFQGQFSLLAAWPSLIPPPTQPQADGYFLKIPLELVPSSFGNFFKTWLNDSSIPGNRNLLAVLETQNLSTIQQNPAVIDFITRFIEAKQSGVRRLAVQDLWSASSVLGAFEPNAYYVVYANLIDRLDGLDYLGDVQIDVDHSGSIFASETRAVLVLKENTNKPFIGTLSIGNDVQAYDLWGCSLPVRFIEDKWTISGSPIVFIDGISPELAKFIASVKFEPDIISGKFGPQELRLKFRNTFNQPVGGMVRVQGTSSWLFDPSGSRFALARNQEFSMTTKLRYPTNETMGTKSIGVKFELEAEKPLTLHLTIPLHLGNTDLKMRVLWFLRGTDLVVWQEITNNTPRMVDLIAFTISPDQPRMERQVSQLGPGQTATKEYSLGLWKNMLGQTIRVGFREVRGNRIANEVITLE
jgi:hypothetical protein